MGNTELHVTMNTHVCVSAVYSEWCKIFRQDYKFIDFHFRGILAIKKYYKGTQIPLNVLMFGKSTRYNSTNWILKDL